MNKQKDFIHNRDWDILIILDACRADTFEDVYKRFLPEGELYTLKSDVDPWKGYATTDWLKKTFDVEHPDITYFSATPRVNSHVPIEGYDATKHFGQIVDVWDIHWDDEYGTVQPKDVVDITGFDSHRENERLIVHFLQPHEPFIPYGIPETGREKDPALRNRMKYKIRSFVGSQLLKSLGHQNTFYMWDMIGMPPINHIHQVLSETGEEGLEMAYRMNLENVLQAVFQLYNRFDKDIVVTSDHGEFLGEQGYYGHSYVPASDEIRHVPWLEL